MQDKKLERCCEDNKNRPAYMNNPFHDSTFEEGHYLEAQDRT